MVTPLHIVCAYSDFRGNDTTGTTCAPAGAIVETHTVDTSFILSKKSNVAKWFFDIFNAEIAQCRQKLDVILETKVVQF